LHGGKSFFVSDLETGPSWSAAAHGIKVEVFPPLDRRVRTTNFSSICKAMLVFRLIFKIPLIRRFADVVDCFPLGAQEAGFHFRIVPAGPLRSL
jgi:hypothetical protein